MTGYAIIQLDEMLQELGEDKTKAILSSFSCNINKDVETFLKEKAIVFSVQGLTKTHLVFASKNERPVLVGYFAISQKYIKVARSVLSSNLRNRIKKFAQYDSNLKEYTLPAPLIGQLGKNFSNGCNALISGDELMGMALEKIRLLQSIGGGKIAYLECEDKECLIEFYERHGFVNFGKRDLERDESDLSGTYLIQMLKYF